MHKWLRCLFGRGPPPPLPKKKVNTYGGRYDKCKQCTTHGEVKLGRDVSQLNRKVAVKSFKLSNITEHELTLLRGEVENYLKMDHPHVARLLCEAVQRSIAVLLLIFNSFRIPGLVPLDCIRRSVFFSGVFASGVRRGSSRTPNPLWGVLCPAFWGECMFEKSHPKQNRRCFRFYVTLTSIVFSFPWALYQIDL